MFTLKGENTVSDGVHAPPRWHLCGKVAVFDYLLGGETSMDKSSIIGLDSAKNVFQAHGARGDEQKSAHHPRTFSFH